MVNQVDLFMGEPLTDEKESVARLNDASIRSLEVKEGDTVEVGQRVGISLKLKNFKVGKAKPEDESKNIVRVNERDFSTANFKAGKKCYVATVYRPKQQVAA